MEEKMKTGKVNKLAFWPAIIALIAFIIAGMINAPAIGNLMKKVLYVIPNYFGSYYDSFS